MPNELLRIVSESVLPFSVFAPGLVEHARVLDASGMIEASFEMHAGILRATVWRISTRGRAQLAYLRADRLGSYGNRSYRREKAN